MSEKIDWSKAPEWASARIRSRATPKLMAWAESYVEGSRFLRDDYDGAECRYLAASFWDLVAERQEKPSWSGEGQPPTGVDIEVLHELYGWIGARVVGQDGEATIVRTNDGYAGVFPHQMRPIRTPEQIAADGREAAIDQMVADTQSAHGWTEAFGMLHDKGYRKP